MNKRKLHHVWTHLRAVKPWYFLLLAALCLIICVFALRANNQRMLELRQAVFTADKDGTDIQKPLGELQAFVTSHMNTDPGTGKNPVYPPIQLQYTYQRLVQARSDEYAKANSQLYNDAQRHCEQQNSADFSGRNRVPCIMQYVESRTTERMAPIPDALYKFSFASPRWSPDLAGWSMVLTAIFGLMFIASFVGQRWLAKQVK
jgi:hypothetical protein